MRINTIHQGPFGMFTEIVSPVAPQSFLLVKKMDNQTMKTSVYAQNPMKEFLIYMQDSKKRNNVFATVMIHHLISFGVSGDLNFLKKRITFTSHNHGRKKNPPMNSAIPKRRGKHYNHCDTQRYIFFLLTLRTFSSFISTPSVNIFKDSLSPSLQQQHQQHQQQQQQNKIKKQQQRTTNKNL
jgi:hypothetical protein